MLTVQPPLGNLNTLKSGREAGYLLVGATGVFTASILAVKLVTSRLAITTS